MIEVPFYNDFYSIITPENKDEIVKHCLDSSLELPKEKFEWGNNCISEKAVSYTHLTLPTSDLV